MVSGTLFKIIILIALFIIFLKMSMQRLAVVTAIGTHMSMKNRTNDIRQNKFPSVETHQRPDGTTFHGDVNVLLGGAMLSAVMTIVCFVCYCCHRNLKNQRSDAIYRQRWLEVDPNMDIYSVEQFYDISANLVTDNDQYTRILKNQGPPPAYEIAVAMKNPISSIKCRLCRNRIRLSCSCYSNIKSGLECDTDNQDTTMPETANQLDRIETTPQQNNTCCCRLKSEYTNRKQRYGFTKTCQICDEEMPFSNNNLYEEDVQNGNGYEGYCQCSNNAHKNDIKGDLSVRELQIAQGKTSPDNRHDMDDNIPSTSGDVNCIRKIDFNSNYEEIDEDNDDEDTAFDSLNANGLIRVDMSQIIDQTGLPTYEAALKLESSGYV